MSRAVLLAVLLGGCGATIDQLDPQPHLTLGKTDKHLAVDVGAVPNVFDMRHALLVRDVHVIRYKWTLRAGFEHAFGGAYSIAPDAAHADLVLVIHRAQPSLHTSNCERSVCERDMRLDYDAELVDHEGRSVARFADGILEKNASWDAATMSLVVSRMFEAIGKGFAPPGS